MYWATISSVELPELTATYHRAQKCRPSKLLPQVWELLMEYSRADPLQPQHDRADVLRWPATQEQVDVIACHFP